MLHIYVLCIMLQKNIMLNDRPVSTYGLKLKIHEKEFEACYVIYQ